MRSSRYRSIVHFLEVAVAVSIGVLLTSRPSDAQTYEVLHGFELPPQAPYAGLVKDSAGNLFGTTYQGGSTGYGTIFELDSSGNSDHAPQLQLF